MERFTEGGCRRKYGTEGLENGSTRHSVGLGSGYVRDGDGVALNSRAVMWWIVALRFLCCARKRQAVGVWKDGPMARKREKDNRRQGSG